jgi:hypothetical protein
MRTLLLSIAAVLIGLGGYVHGVWTDRWSVSPELEEAIGKLPRVPLTFGDWRGQAQSLRPREAEQAGFSAHLMRRYERHDGAVVNVMLACGRAGPLAVHTPEVCYVGAGFALAGPATRYTAEGAKLSPAAEFWKGKFSREGVATAHQRVFWGWHARGAWVAADSPRWAFRGLPMLHKDVHHL